MIRNGVNGKEVPLSSTISPNPSRGEVWNVDFDPTIGSEIEKTRPAVVVSIDNIGILPIKIVAPFTKWKTEFSGRIWLVRIKQNKTNGLTKESAVDTLQIKGIDILRFCKKLGQLTAAQMDDITAAIAAIIDYQ